MRLVNCNNPSLKSDTIYHSIPQPMEIYHSTEELHANEEFYEIIQIADLYEAYKSTTFPEHKFFKRIPMPTFIATGETFVPSTFTKEGFKLYEADGMDVKKTDNCYVRLYGIMYRPGGSKQLVTSTGVWSLSLTPAVSAAVPPKITHERGWNLKLNREVRKKSVDKITNSLKISTKMSVMDYKFITRLLNPLAGDSFLNPLKAGLDTYRPNANQLPKQDILEIIASERVQKLILKELQVVMPELAKAIQEKTKPEAIATMLQQIADDTIANKEQSVQEKLLSVQAILNAGYPDQGVILNPPADKIMIGVPMGGNGGPAQNIIPYEQPKVMGGQEVANEIKPEPDSIEDDKPKPEEKDLAEDLVSSVVKDNYEKLKEDAGHMEGVTFDDNLEFQPLNLGEDLDDTTQTTSD